VLSVDPVARDEVELDEAGAALPPQAAAAIATAASQKVILVITST
jgi:hypothetical protein